MKTILAFLVAATLFACAANPVKDAQTTEQKAFALYGEFVVFEEEGAKLIKSSEVSDSIKQRIRQADASAKPAADALLGGIQELLSVKDTLSAGATTNDKLQIAVNNLQKWYNDLSPLVGQLTSAVKGR